MSNNYKMQMFFKGLALLITALIIVFIVPRNTIFLSNIADWLPIILIGIAFIFVGFSTYYFVGIFFQNKDKK
jgi:hypothetical protein